MKKQLLMLLIAAEVIIFVMLLLGDIGVVHTALAQQPIRNILMHITAVVVIYICISAYRRSE